MATEIDPDELKVETVDIHQFTCSQQAQNQNDANWLNSKDINIEKINISARDKPLLVNADLKV